MGYCKGGSSAKIPETAWLLNYQNPKHVVDHFYGKMIDKRRCV